MENQKYPVGQMECGPDTGAKPFGITTLPIEMFRYL
jgi:hypothetical protein